MNIEHAKSISLALILDKLNLKPVRISEYDLYYNNPFRRDEKADFRIDLHENCWNDEDTGERGGVLQFVCKHLQRSGLGSTEFDALRWIGNMFGLLPAIKPIANIDIQQDDLKLNVTDQKKIEHPALIEFLESRGIPSSLADRYLKEVNVYSRVKCKSIFALGFKNDKGGHVLRNKYFKGCCSPQYLTFIRGKIPKPNTIHIFIDWLDYLSAIIQQRNGRKLEGDTIVLNGLRNLAKATPYIKGYGYRQAFTWMSNDQEGKEAITNLDTFFATEDGLSHKPMNSLYAPYKDVNAWHMVKVGLPE
ncbi:hypothetical protein [Chitinophaga pinensis]|uniref:Toprim domain-containing protein n=1 Tax=Chitinophaga pinensis (strain ATCC 43595 / DSM 2588 / LMG 13176 / NBRC 15968 / NCIMB 11800 / UQM 2034) TaxID=485918 RepID=A0A979GTF3_CHIPD|nr:hypothetical protein [Chitinophaga pinensis]ACU63742.1 hypothetical protein Cpin_6337 [Chitinophaga pinensis DSM 2588]